MTSLQLIKTLPARMTTCTKRRGKKKKKKKKKGKKKKEGVSVAFRLI
jgi:hypothetical protein